MSNTRAGICTCDNKTYQDRVSVVSWLVQFRSAAGLWFDCSCTIDFVGRSYPQLHLPQPHKPTSVLSHPSLPGWYKTPTLEWMHIGHLPTLCNTPTRKRCHLPQFHTGMIFKVFSAAARRADDAWRSMLLPVGNIPPYVQPCMPPRLHSASTRLPPDVLGRPPSAVVLARADRSARCCAYPASPLRQFAQTQGACEV